MASLVCALAVFGVGAPASADSGFTRAQYSVYAKLAMSSFRSDRFYDLAGTLSRGDDLTLRALQLYTEFGVTDHFTVFLNWPALRANSYEGSTRVLGTGDLQLGLKYGFEWGRHRLALIAVPEFPSGDEHATVSQSSTLASGEEVTRNIGLPTGDGEFNLWSRVAYSASLHEIGSWVSADFGINLRTQGYAHQLAFGVEFGHFLLERVYLQARFRGQIVPSDDLQLGTGFIYGEGTEFLSVGAGVAVPIPSTPIGVAFDWDQIVAHPRNVYAGPQFTVGIYFECGPRSSPDAAVCH